jgi:hypothetical protein
MVRLSGASDAASQPLSPRRPRLASQRALPPQAVPSSSVQSELGAQALQRRVEAVDDASILRDPALPYAHHFGLEMVALSSRSTLRSNDR